jgi:hypothetical protein
MTGTRDQFIPGIYRQHILAGIIIAGHQHVGIGFAPVPWRHRL